MKIPSRRAAYWCSSIVIAVLLIILNWNYLSGFALKHLARFLAGRAGIELTIGSASGGILFETVLSKVSIRPGKDRPQTFHFKARSLRCAYDPWELRNGLEPFIEGLDCTAEEPAYLQDFSVAVPGRETPPGEPRQFSPPPFLPVVQVNNGAVILTGTGWSVQIQGMNARLHPVATGPELLLEAESFRVNQGHITRIETGLAARLRYEAGVLLVDRLDLGAERITASGSLDLTRIGRGDTEFAADLVFGESRLDLAGSVTDRVLKVRGGTENFAVGELQKRLGGEGWDISGEIRAEAELTMDLQVPADLEGSFTFALADGLVSGVAISTASTGEVKDKRFEIPRAEAEIAGSRLALTDVSLPVEPLMAAEPLPIITAGKAEFTAEITDLATVLKLFGLEARTVPKAYRAESLSFRGRLADGVLHLEEAAASAADFRLAIGPGEIGVPAELSAWGTVPVELTATLESSDLSGVVGRFAEIPLSGRAAAGIDLKGKLLEAHAEIKLSGDGLEFGEKQLGSLDLLATVDFLQEKPGVPGQLRFKISELTQENESGSLALDSPVSGSWQPAGDLAVNGAFLVDGQGVVAANLTMTPDQVTNYEISVDNLDSDGWLGNFVDQRYFFQGAYLEGSFSRPPQGPSLALTGRVAKSGAIDIAFPLSGRFDLRYSPSGLAISEFNWQSRENLLQLSGHIPYDPLAEEPFLDGELALRGKADIPALEDIGPLPANWSFGGGSLDLDLDLKGSWQNPEGHIILEAAGIEPKGELSQYFNSPVNLTGELLARKDGIVLKSAELESDRYSARATGSYQPTFSLGELLRKSQNSWRDGEIGLDATVRLKDLNFLRDQLPWLRRLEGDMEAEVHVEGMLAAPGIKGALSLQNGEVSHAFNFPILSEVNLQAEFDEHSITIVKMRAELGGAPINLGGKISRRGETLTLTLYGDGENVLLFRNNYMLARGNVALEVSGPLEKLAVNGTVGLTYGYYTRNIDFLGKIGSSGSPVSEGVGSLFSFPEPPLKNAVFNIGITTIEPFRIRNNLVRSALRPELSLKGTGELPYLVGTIYIDPSRLLLPSGRLQIQSGVITFPEEDPDRPRLDIVGRSKVLGYDINVVTSGPVSDPVISLSSSPALPNDDLLLLLLTGQPPERDLSGDAGASGTRNVMVYLGRDFLGKWLEDDTGGDDESILDRFELDMGRNVTRSGEQTVEATFRLSKEVEEEGEVYYLSAEKDRYDAYNYGLKVVFRFE